MASRYDDSDSGRLYPIPIFGIDDSSSDGEENTNQDRSFNNSRGQGRGQGRGENRGRGRVRGDKRGRGKDRGSRSDQRRGDRDFNSDGDESIVSSISSNDDRGQGQRRGENRGRGRVRGDNRGRGRGRGSGADRRRGNHDRSSSRARDFSGNDRVDERSIGGKMASSSDSYNDSVKDENHKNRTSSIVQPMKFHKLIHLSKQSDEPDTVLMEISNTRSGFKEFIEGTIEAKCYFILFKVLKNVLGSHQLQGIRQLLQLVEQYLLSKVPEFLNDICMRSQETRYLWNKKSDLETLITNMVAVMNKTMTTLHSSVSKCSVMILQLQQVQMHFFPDGSQSNVIQEIEEAREMQKSIVEEMARLRQEQTKKNTKPKRTKAPDEGLPPEDFRTLSILPTLIDLQMDEKPFLRANKTKGKYDSLETYLDIQFRLLREDYISPLRSGISAYRECIKAKGNVSRLRDIRLYNDVQILRPICSPSGINHVIQFDVSKFKNMNWVASKRLLHGSLLCLSNDHFETAVYAIVTDRKEKDLTEGMLQVHFENLPEWIQANDKFIMAESTTYFEAYRHILQGLQEAESLPLERYILECETFVKPPEYLLRLGFPEYKFRCIMNTKDGNNFPVLDTSQWPSKSSLQLDASQYEALQAATTKELAIIQGPPGTGKTYVGLKIAKLLIYNKQTWERPKDEDRSGSHAILVVCYTNHALDQFLEGIHEFSKGGIVRIGGRCNSEVLNEYVLKNIKQKKREERTRSWGIRQSEMDCRRELRECEQLITDVSIKLRRSRTEIISLDQLCRFMTEEQVLAFTKKTKGGRDKCLYEWLNLTIRESDSQRTPIDEAEQVKRIWETYIIEKADAIPGQGSITLPVWHMDLHSRARLYKSWIFDFIGNIELKLQDIRQRGSIESLRAAEEILEKLIMFTETEIVKGGTLIKYVENPMYISQIKQLSNSGISLDESTITWLCLDKTSESTNAIKSTLASLENSEEPEKDLEEDRELVDDDGFLGYCDDDEDENQKFPGASENENWVIQWEKKKTKQEVTAMLRNAAALTKDEADRLVDVWNLPLKTKRNLYAFWMEEYRNFLRDHVKEREKQFNELTLRLEEVREQETLGILKSANFIGMTTTGAAKYRSLLQQVAPRIIIVEEAAEVLESHVITTLNDECQHLILIGDHKQLRPSTTVYELSKRYNLDISLFERLVNNGVPCVTLSEQHRMRPSISALMRHKNLYPHLRDHLKVHTYENVKGLDVNIQFISHEINEETNAESTSYYNTFEARFLAKFCSHLLKQGYTPDQISVLSPYMGQVLTIRKEMPKKEFDGVRITAVDNFQGEENDIILLSLVRSSKPRESDKRNPIGFLGIENRVCVALSRAKIGLFVFGNFTLLKNCSEMWDYMVTTVHKVGKVGPCIKLICQNHPQNVLEVSESKGFDQAPDGGCREPCGCRLECGHICERFCHILDKEHKFVKCFKPCPKKCEFGHQCKKKCYQECKKCDTLVEKTIPKCGHKVMMPCHKDPSSWKCETSCSFKLSCGHACKQPCHKCTTESHTVDCKVKCDRTLRCGHNVKVECYRGIDVECTVTCDAVLDCGHKCSGKCGVCHSGRIHSGCKGTCNKTLLCGHKCPYPCSEICPPCSRKCEQRCSHMVKCARICSDPCNPCMEDCTFKCKHKVCENPCYDRCMDISCDKPCQLGIQTKPGQDKCDHKCSGLCGERCPKICVKCNEDKISDEDYTYAEGDRFIELPDCGHIIEVKRLDEVIRKPLDARGEMVKRCPKKKCKKVIRTEIRRYANVLKEVRQACLKKIEKLTGTEKERIRKVEALKSEVKALEDVGTGLQDEDVNTLMKQINPSKFGKLLISTRKNEYFMSLLKVRKELRDFLLSSRNRDNFKICQDGVEDAKLVHAILLRDKQYVTKQYWREIGLEIKRLDNILFFMRLQEKHHSGFSNGLVESYCTKSMTILTDGKPFDQTREGLIDKVKERITNPSQAIGNDGIFDGPPEPKPRLTRPHVYSPINKMDQRGHQITISPSEKSEKNDSIPSTRVGGLNEQERSSDSVDTLKVTELELGSDEVSEVTSTFNSNVSQSLVRDSLSDSSKYLQEKSQSHQIVRPLSPSRPSKTNISERLISSRVTALEELQAQYQQGVVEHTNRDTTKYETENFDDRRPAIDKRTVVRDFTLPLKSDLHSNSSRPSRPLLSPKPSNSEYQFTTAKIDKTLEEDMVKNPVTHQRTDSYQIHGIGYKPSERSSVESVEKKSRFSLVHERLSHDDKNAEFGTAKADELSQDLYAFAKVKTTKDGKERTTLKFAADHTPMGDRTSSVVTDRVRKAPSIYTAEEETYKAERYSRSPDSRTRLRGETRNLKVYDEDGDLSYGVDLKLPQETDLDDAFVNFGVKKKTDRSLEDVVASSRVREEAPLEVKTKRVSLVNRLKGLFDKDHK